MSKQYDKLIRILDAQHSSTSELKYLNRGRVRPDLIGDNDVA